MKWFELGTVERDGVLGQATRLAVHEEGLDGFAQRRRAGIFQNPLFLVEIGVHDRMTFLNTPK